MSKKGTTRRDKAAEKIAEMKSRQEESGFDSVVESYVKPMQQEKGGIVNLEIDLLQDAPKEWNFFQPLPEDKMIELVESIQENGILHNLIAWEHKPGLYMILSGHNRVAASWHLFEITGEEKYLTVPTVIKGPELTEQQARQIIVDSNWCQRELSPMEKNRAIMIKYVYFKDIYDYSNKDTMELIGTYFNIGWKQVSNLMRLGNLIPPFRHMFDSGQISQRNALKLSYMSEEEQDRLYEDFGSNLTNSVLSRASSYQEIRKVASGDLEVKTITVKIPAKHEHSFRKFYKEWLEAIKKQDSVSGIE